MTDDLTDGTPGAGIDPVTGLRTPRERALTRERRAGLDPEGTMRIGEVAERLGLSLRSIRHYEECGLVSPAGRTTGGFRLYAEGDVQRLLLIMQMKPLGYTLDEMRLVLDDLDALADGSARDDARARLLALGEDVDRRWESLRQRLEIAAMFRDHLRAELAAPSE